MLKPRNSSIQDFLDNPRYNNCEDIQFNWRVFTDNEQLDYEDKPLNERFPVESKYILDQRHVKTTVRGKLDYNKFKKNDNPHSVYSNIKACSSSGKVTTVNKILKQQIRYRKSHFLKKGVFINNMIFSI